MIRRVLVLVAGLAALTVVLSVRAQEPTRPADKADKIKEDLTLQQQNLKRRFDDFQQQLLRLQQRLEKSPRKEDQDKALVLKKALERAQDSLISTQFDSLVDYLKNQKFTKVGEIKAAHERTLKLADDLREVLALLNENSRSLQLREERLRLEEMLKRLERIIHDQKVARSINEINSDKKAAKNAQAQVSKATEKLVRDIPGKDGKGGEAKQAKGENKDGGKGEGKKGEGKNAGKSADTKKGEGKDGGKAGEGKKGEGKKGEAKAGDPKSGPKTAKAGDKTGAAKSSKGGEAKAGDAKSGKSGDGKKGEAKSGKAGDGKKGEAKSGAKGDEKKAGDAKTGPKIRTKEEEKKPGEAKSSKGDGKQGDAKSSKGGEAKSADSKSGGKSQSKQGEAKAGSKSSGKGQAKSNGSPPPETPPASSKKGGDDNGDKKQPPQQPSGPQDDTAQAKKRIKEAGYDQHRAEDNIDKGDKKTSKEDQDKAVQKLEDAKKKLEDLLRQLREEELDRLLANLQARCEKMLAMQINVQDGTIRVAKEIAKTEDKKATRDHQQDSLKLSDKEKDIVVEANKAIEMLEAEGSAVAFPEVFQQVREDMKNVQRRLGIVDVGTVTQGVEQDIVDTLKEMIEALKKAKQELDNKKSQSKSQQQQQQQVDQKLLDEIAELKMIRSMQIRVNSRTHLYGREYEGEQADAPRIQQELRQLSDRQDRIYEVTNRIAKGDNR
jgi:hypothetical protein